MRKSYSFVAMCVDTQLDGEKTLPNTIQDIYLSIDSDQLGDDSRK